MHVCRRNPPPGGCRGIPARSLEALEAEETWTDEERHRLDEKVDRALAQVAAGQVYGPEEARRKLAAL